MKLIAPGSSMISRELLQVKDFEEKSTADIASCFN